MELFKVYSYKRGAALAIGSTFVWKLLSFVNSILIAFYFGTQTKSDVYFYIISISGLIVSFSNSLNKNVLIPQTIYLKRESEQEAKTFLNSFLLLYTGLLLVILGICFIFPLDIFKIVSKFSADILNQDILILRLAFLYFSSCILCYFVLDIMYIYRIFSINFLFPLNALIPMLFLVFFHNILGLKTMLIGFIISHFIQILIGLAIIKKKLNWPFTSFKITLEKRFKSNILTNQTLVITNCLSAWIPVYLMSSVAGGIISALSYAKQLTDAPSEILTSKITGVYHIQLNENASSKDFNALNTNFIKVNYLILFIMVPLVLFTCYFAPDIINLFFKRGKFDSQSALTVVKFLRPLMLSLLISALSPFAGSIIASVKKIKESFKYMIFKDTSYVVIMYLFVYYFGPFAYPYALICCFILGYLVESLFFKRYIPEIRFWHPLKDACLLISLNILALIPAAFAGHLLTEQIEFIKIFFSGIVFLSVLALLYAPTGQLKKILSSSLGARYELFINKLPPALKHFLFKQKFF